ncbi:hypothetical protein CW310_09330 [Pseudomonas citronellolis]|nr:hypothetical protein CW310_09330 [Pseudomonas citronellolis]
MVAPCQVPQRCMATFSAQPEGTGLLRRAAAHPSCDCATGSRQVPYSRWNRRRRGCEQPPPAPLEGPPGGSPLA